MSNFCVRQKLEKCINHPQSGPKDRNKDDSLRKRVADRGLQWALNLSLLRRKTLPCFRSKKQADPATGRTKCTRRRPMIPKNSEAVVCKWVLESRQFH